MITIRATETIADLRRFAVGLQETVQYAIAEGLRDAVRFAEFKLSNQTQRHTGRLFQGIDSAVTGTASGRLFNLTPYARYVEYGTRPHGIAPKRRKALRFQVGGSYVFAKRVHHPGTTARPFMMPAAHVGGERIAQRLNDRISRLAARH